MAESPKTVYVTRRKPDNTGYEFVPLAPPANGGAWILGQVTDSAGNSMPTAFTLGGSLYIDPVDNTIKSKVMRTFNNGVTRPLDVTFTPSATRDSNIRYYTLFTSNKLAIASVTLIMETSSNGSAWVEVFRDEFNAGLKLDNETKMLQVQGHIAAGAQVRLRVANLSGGTLAIPKGQEVQL